MFLVGLAHAQDDSAREPIATAIGPLQVPAIRVHFGLDVDDPMFQAYFGGAFSGQDVSAFERKVEQGLQHLVTHNTFLRSEREWLPDEAESWAWSRCSKAGAASDDRPCKACLARSKRRPGASAPPLTYHLQVTLTGDYLRIGGADSFAGTYLRLDLSAVAPPPDWEPPNDQDRYVDTVSGPPIDILSRKLGFWDGDGAFWDVEAHDPTILTSEELGQKILERVCRDIESVGPDGNFHRVVFSAPLALKLPRLLAVREREVEVPFKQADLRLPDARDGHYRGDTHLELLLQWYDGRGQCFAEASIVPATFPAGGWQRDAWILVEEDAGGGEESADKTMGLWKRRSFEALRGTLDAGDAGQVNVYVSSYGVLGYLKHLD